MPKLKIGFEWYVAEGTQYKICGFAQTRFVYYLFEHIVYGLLNKNKCSKANHYLDHMLRVLQSISDVKCSQKL